ncbi:MAG: single-stranded-DNA-specific exonuclease RecJ [bacterium]|nr:single-stranded-DNA-specific exonuclease RecJ [bacterium]
MEKKWEYKYKQHKREDITRISKKYSLHPIITAVLLNRGISEDKIKPYFTKSMHDIINPFEMKDMDKAVARIMAALEKREPIVVYGDYDVDGITSTAILYDFLRSHGADVEYYIPERSSEGYGINIRAVNKLIKKGKKLLISVDCGITAIGETSFAHLQGMDVIITDHHTCKERIPEDAVAVIDPKQEDDTYPFDSLCGAGIAFKLILAVTMAMGSNTSQCFNKYIDLVAIGTIADVVPLIDENRIFVDRGLRLLQKPSRPGIRALMEVSGSRTPVNSSTIGFTLAPRLNASGRLYNASIGVDLLLCEDYNEALETAKKLDFANRKRQSEEQKIFDQALDMIARDVNFEKKKVIVLSNTNWHQGVIGIVASRLNERYYKPCILISDDGKGNGKGSGRSVPGFNLFDALTACSDFLIGFGGHSAAAGLNVNISDITKFSEAINKYADKCLSPDMLVPKLCIDCPINPGHATLQCAKALSKLEPFGMNNEKPVFSMDNLEIVYVSTVGADNNHLRLKLTREGISLNGIGFSLGSLASELSTGMIINAAFQLDINYYLGVESVQLIIKDLKIMNR